MFSVLSVEETLRPPLVLKAGQDLIPFDRVLEVKLDNVEDQTIVIVCRDGVRYTAHGTDAIDAIMVLKPSAFEGRRLRWPRNAWVFHNLVGHPGMQLLAWVGFKRAAVAFHDWTTPRTR